MNLGAIIEVAIGLIFVWIVLSLATSQIQEWISTKLDKRARDLEDAIHEILANPNLKAQFYDHPVIRGLTSKKRKKPSIVPAWFYRYPIVRGFTQEKREIPSYIPARQFALTLFDIALTAGTESSIIQQAIYRIRDDLQKEKPTTRQRAAIEDLNILADLARSAAATEAGIYVTSKSLKLLKAEVKKFSDEYSQFQPVIDAAFEEADKRQAEMAQLLKEFKATKGADPALTEVRRGVTALSVISPELNQTLSALLLNVEHYITEGESTLARARQGVEQWFNASMDRVSGAFKRYSQWMALIIGFAIAFLANVDSISLTLYLWREPSVRQVLANKAQAFDLSFSQQASDGQTTPYEAVQNFTEQFSGLNLPIGWTLKENDDAIFRDPNSESQPHCSWFPTGNDYFGVPFFEYRLTNSIGFLQNKCFMPSQPDHSTNVLLKLLGIAMTAIAARQGAPFWFDFLNRFVNLRGTGTKPAEG